MKVQNVWMHELPMPETPKRKVKVVGPYDIVGSDVNLLKDTMCHYLGWQQLCYGPRGREVGSLGVESWRGKRVREPPGPKPRSPEIPKPKVSFGEPCST
jgi:hypothetical protein